MHPSAHEKENTEEEDACYGKRKRVAHADRAEENEQDAQGQHPAPVVLHLTVDEIRLVRKSSLGVGGHDSPPFIWLRAQSYYRCSSSTRGIPKSRQKGSSLDIGQFVLTIF